MSGLFCSPIPEDKMMSYIYDDVDDSDVFALESTTNYPEEDAKAPPKQEKKTPSTEISKENELLKETIKKLAEEKDILERRISEIYKTAKAELERKDRRLRELNEEKNNLLFRRNPNGFRNRQQQYNDVKGSIEGNELNRANKLSPKKSGKIDLRNKITHSNKAPKPDPKNQPQTAQTEFSKRNRPVESSTHTLPSISHLESVPKTKMTDKFESSTDQSEMELNREHKPDKVQTQVQSTPNEVQEKTEISIKHKPMLEEVQDEHVQIKFIIDSTDTSINCLEPKEIEQSNQKGEKTLEPNSQKLVENKPQSVEVEIEDRHLTNDEFQRFDCLNYKIPKKKSNHNDKLSNQEGQKSILTKPEGFEKNSRNCDGIQDNKKSDSKSMHQKEDVNRKGPRSKSRSIYIKAQPKESKSPGRDKGIPRKTDSSKGTSESEPPRSRSNSRPRRSRSKSRDARIKTSSKREHKSDCQTPRSRDCKASSSPSNHKTNRSKSRSVSSSETRHKEDRRSQSSSASESRRHRPHSRERIGSYRSSDRGITRKGSSEDSRRRHRSPPRPSEEQRTKKPPRTPPGSPPRESAEKRDKTASGEARRRSRSPHSRSYRSRRRSPVDWRYGDRRSRGRFPDRGVRNGGIHRQSRARDSPFGFNRKVMQNRLKERETRREMLREAYRERKITSFYLGECETKVDDNSMLEMEDLSVSNLDDEALERLLAKKQLLVEEIQAKSDAESGEITDDDILDTPQVKSKVEKIDNSRKNERKLSTPKKEPVKKCVDLKWQSIGGESVNNYRKVVEVREQNKHLEDERKQVEKSRCEKYIPEENKPTDPKRLSYEEIFTKAQEVKKECLAFDLIKKENIHVKMKECIEPFTKEDAHAVCTMAKFLKKASEVFVFEDANPNRSNPSGDKTDGEPVVVEKKKIGLDAYKRRQCSASKLGYVEEKHEIEAEQPPETSSKDEKSLEVVKEKVDPLVTKPNDPTLSGDTVVKTTADVFFHSKSPHSNHAHDCTNKDSNSFLRDFDMSDDEEPVEPAIEVKCKKETKINIIDITIIKPSVQQKAQQEIQKPLKSQDVESIEQIQEAVYGMTGPETLTNTNKALQTLNTEELERCLEEDVGSGCQMVVDAQLVRKNDLGSEEFLRDLPDLEGSTPEKAVAKPLKGTKEKMIDLFGSPLSSCSPLDPKPTKETKHPAAKVKRNLSKNLPKPTKKRQAAKKNLTADEILLQEVKHAKSEHSQSLNSEKPAIEEIQKHFAFFNSPCHIPLIPFPPKLIEEHTNKCNQAKQVQCEKNYSESISDSSDSSPIRPVVLKKKRAEKNKIKIKMSFGQKKAEEGSEKVQNNKKKKQAASKRKPAKKASKKDDNKKQSESVKPETSNGEKSITSEDKPQSTPSNKTNSGEAESNKTPAESNLRRSVRTRKPSVLYREIDELPETPRSVNNTTKTPKRITPLRVGEVDKKSNMMETAKRKSVTDLEMPNAKVAKIENKLPQIMETYTNIQESDSQLSSLTKIQQMSEEILNKSSESLPKLEKSPFKMPFDLSLQDESFSHIKTLHIEESSTLLNLFQPEIQHLLGVCPSSDKSLFTNEDNLPKVTNFANCLDTNTNAFTSTPIKVVTKPLTSCSNTGVSFDVNATVDKTKNYINKPLKRDRRKRVGMVMFDI